MKEFEKQKESDEQDLADIEAAENKKKLEAFIKTEKNIQTSTTSSGKFKSYLEMPSSLKSLHF